MFNENVPRSINKQKTRNTAVTKDKNDIVEKSTYKTELTKEERPIIKFVKNILKMVKSRT